MKVISSTDPYIIFIKGFEQCNMRLYESLLSLSNGYMGMRGNFEESYAADSLMGTYFAGVWYPDKTRVGWWKNGYPEYFGKVVNAPKLTGIKVWVDEEEIDLSKQTVLDFNFWLDMRTAQLHRCAVVQTSSGRVRIESSRFVSVCEKELCAVKYTVTPLDKDIRVKLVPHIDFNVKNEDANYGECFWESVREQSAELFGYVEAAIKPNPFNNNIFRAGIAMTVVPVTKPKVVKTKQKNGYIANELTYLAEKNMSAAVQKIVAVKAGLGQKTDAQQAVYLAKRGSEQGYDELFERHRHVFSARMESTDVAVEGDASIQQGIRYNLFQLLSTYAGEGDGAIIGPKGFTGEKYGGAAYWDTEAFLVPFYLGIMDQKVVDNLLRFRCKTLPQAIENAAKLRLNGALYPMVTFDGYECHNEWEITFEEIHRNGAIAYAIFNYVTYTGDTAWLVNFGFDILLQIARFWESRVHYHAQKNVYMIHGVTGPNEYENNINNNWYTNFIAKWCLEYTAEVWDRLRASLQVKVEKNEIRRFEHIARKMYLPYDEELDIFVQHDGFLDKEIKNADTIDSADKPICQNWSWDRILRSCFIKQADVVQGLYMFTHMLDSGSVKRNFDFYEPMTVHESSLSAGVHAVVAARTGSTDKALELLRHAVRLDLDDINADTQDGLHITSMSGGWLAVVHGFAGMQTARQRLEFAPCLPDGLEGYAFSLHYRNRRIHIKVNTNSAHAFKKSGESMPIVFYGKTYQLEDALCVPLSNVR